MRIVAARRADLLSRASSTHRKLHHPPSPFDLSQFPVSLSPRTPSHLEVQPLALSSRAGSRVERADSFPTSSLGTSHGVLR